MPRLHQALVPSPLLVVCQVGVLEVKRQVAQCGRLAQRLGKCRNPEWPKIVGHGAMSDFRGGMECMQLADGCNLIQTLEL